MSRHFTRRAPKRNEGLSWGRFPTDDGSAATYRLFRRDHTGRLHFEARTFLSSDSPLYIASHLRRMKRELRNRVDGIDLKAMGVAA